MNARTYLVTAVAVIALAAPAIQSAGASIPADEHSAWVAISAMGPTHQVKGGSLKKTHRKHAGTSSTAIRVGAYNAHAYVNGGASQRVAKAITKAGKKKATHRTPAVAPVKLTVSLPVPLLAGGIPEPCLLDNICTDLQSCELWGLNCELVQPVAPVADAVPVESPSTEVPPAVETPPCVSLADANSLIDYPDGYDLSC